MDLGITGKRAVVAASSAGLGFEAARHLAAEGVKVVMCGRDEAKLTAAAKAVGPNAIPIVADVSTAAAATTFINDAIEVLGGIDILVANGGGPPPGNFASTPVEAYPDALELNLLATVAMCKVAVPLMQAQQWGRAVAIVALAVRQPMAQLILSNTARAGLTGFLKTVAREVARDGVTVNSVCPGLHATDRIKQLMPGDDSTEGIPAGTMGRAEDFGAIVAFLCSDQARYVTGTALAVDGGLDAALF